MKIYHYHRVTNEYIGETEAKPSPLEDGVYLVPAFATDLPVPDEAQGMARVFSGVEWNLIEDNRGTYYDINRNPVVITEIGVPIPEDYTIEPRPLTLEEIQAEQVKKLEADLAAIDVQVQLADKQPFEYNGHSYYPDTEFIQGMFSMLPYLPEGYTETWKTAEKETDGLTNVYVVLDKEGIAGLAGAYLQFKKDNWITGETRKAELKEEYLGG